MKYRIEERTDRKGRVYWIAARRREWFADWVLLYVPARPFLGFIRRETCRLESRDAAIELAKADAAELAKRELKSETIEL